MTKELNLSESDIKEAIVYWLRSKGINEDMAIKIGYEEYRYNNPKFVGNVKLLGEQTEQGSA